MAKRHTFSKSSPRAMIVFMLLQINLIQTSRALSTHLILDFVASGYNYSASNISVLQLFIAATLWIGPVMMDIKIYSQDMLHI